ncbi:MAG: hypothetical protein ABIR24_06085 [Verrucomicrobiota bacterium]
MEFLKKHYEKILLSFVLLCLAVAAAWLPVKIKKEKEDLQKTIFNLPKPKELKPVDLTTNEMALKRLQNPPTVELSGAHNLFNPVTWKIKSDQTFTKIVREGVDALIITNIRPLNMELAFERVTASGYWIGVKRKGEKKPSIYVKLNEKKPLPPDLTFTLKEVKGPPEEPDELVLEFAESLQEVSINKAKPFQKIEAYAADLRYPPDSKSFSNQKVNDVIAFGGESYKIIAINENDARVSAISTDKRTTILWKGAPVAPAK